MAMPYQIAASDVARENPKRLVRALDIALEPQVAGSFCSQYSVLVMRARTRRKEPAFCLFTETMELSRSPGSIPRAFSKQIVFESECLTIAWQYDFDGVPLVFAKFGVSLRKASADQCTAEKHVEDWLLRDRYRSLWLSQRSSHVKTQAAEPAAFPLTDCADEPGVAPTARGKKQVTRAWCLTSLQTRKHFLHCSHHKTHEPLVDFVRLGHKTPVAQKRALTAAGSPGTVVCGTVQAAAVTDTRKC